MQGTERALAQGRLRVFSKTVVNPHLTGVDPDSESGISRLLGVPPTDSKSNSDATAPLAASPVDNRFDRFVGEPLGETLSVLAGLGSDPPDPTGLAVDLRRCVRLLCVGGGLREHLRMAIALSLLDASVDAETMRLIKSFLVPLPTRPRLRHTSRNSGIVLLRSIATANPLKCWRTKEDPSSTRKFACPGGPHALPGSVTLGIR